MRSFLRTLTGAQTDGDDLDPLGDLEWTVDRPPAR